MNTRFLILLASLVVTAPAWAGDELVIYSGRSDKFVQPVVDAFALETGISVVLHTGKATELLNRLRLEGNRTTADVFISNDAGNLQVGSDLQLFAPLPAALTKDIPANYRATDNTWTGVSARARVLVINKKFKQQHAIKSVLDLSRPELKNQIGITDSTNESYIAGVTVYMQALGTEPTRAWLQGLKTNAGNEVFSKHSHIVKAVAQGQKGVGLVNHYYIFRHLKEYPNDPVELLLPDQSAQDMGLAWNVAGIAQTAHGKHKDKAMAFIKFVLTDKGQGIFAETNLEYPVRSGVKTAQVLPAADKLKIADVPMAALGQMRKQTIDLIESVGMP